MTAPDPGRRRFLGGLAAVVAVAAAAGLARIRSGTTPPSSTAAPQGSGASAAAASTTRAAAAAPATTTRRTTPPTTTAQPAAAVSALCREAWGALPAAGEFRTHTIERMTVHHTAALLETNAQAPSRIRQHQRYHIDLGWPDLAYHFIVDANGHVYQGRPVDAIGDTGTDYDPTGHFLVCAEGNFDDQEITHAQLDSVVSLLAWGAETFEVTPSTIRGHRDWATTSCPGDTLYPTIATGDLARAVQARLDDGGVALTVVCGPAATRVVADVEAGDV